MKQDDRAEQQPPLAGKKSVRPWLWGSVVTLLLLVLAALLLAPHLINSGPVKQKIQEMVAEKTGGQLDYQALDLTYWPQLAIELRQVALTLPEKAQARVATLRVSPEFLPLLTGQLRLNRIELEAPELTLALSDTKKAAAPARPYAVAVLEKRLATALEKFGQEVNGLELLVNNGRLAVVRGRQTLVETDGLTLRLGVIVNDPHSAEVTLLGEIPALTLHRQGQTESIKGVKLKGSARLAGGEISVSLVQLVLVEPAFELTGSLTLAPTAPGITLNLTGSSIDVDATRRIFLSLAGETSPSKEIFAYLRGGHVPRISFRSQGESPSELGKLNNIQVEGQLQNGQVSIPQSKLDLTEVSGDVVISEGILQGSRMSTRLEGSTGRDGSLKLGLTRGNNLFQLELTVHTDLRQAQPILLRVVANPTFVAELKKISNLQGTGQGRLVLGDRLNNITARVEVSELKLSADYQGVPFPISISQGQFVLTAGQVKVGKLRGKLGESQFAELSGQLRWKKALSLDITAGRFGLDMTELYPWLASLPGLHEPLADVKEVRGRIDLAALKLKGVVDKPAEWQYTLSGSVQDLSVDTSLFPDTIRLARGDFEIDAQQLVVQNLQTSGLDASLTLGGSLKGFPQRLDRVELFVAGRMGPDSVEWLRGRLKVPESYAIHAPLNISNAAVSWQADSTTSFNGAVSIENGPAINADVDHHPDRLQVHRLTIKDQYSDASMAFDLKEEGRDIQFAGKLQHETLQSLFVNPPFSSGRLEGELAVSLPRTGTSRLTARGQLTGENLPVLLPSGDEMAIERVRLNADDSQIQVDVPKLTWRGLTWEPVIATVSFERDRTDIRVRKSKLCGIDAHGLFSLAGEEVSLDMTLAGEGLDVSTSYTCLTQGQVKMSGALAFSSQISAKGKTGELVTALQGPLEMTFSNGVIEQEKRLARILEVLNVTEIVKGRLPDLGSSGFAYTTLTLEGEFQSGKLIIQKLFMDGETLDLIGNGEAGLQDKSIDVELLAAPFKTVDSVVKNIPGVNYLLAGSLVTIPIRITGDRADPKVQVMSASSVGSALLGLGERIIKSPIKLMETTLPGKKE